MTWDEFFLGALLVAMAINVSLLVHELIVMASIEKWFEEFKNKMKGFK